MRYPQSCASSSTSREYTSRNASLCHLVVINSSTVGSTSIRTSLYSSNSPLLCICQAIGPTLPASGTLKSRTSTALLPTGCAMAIRGSLCRVDQNLDLAPFVSVELGMLEGGELLLAVVVMAGAVVPVAAAGGLKLDGAESVEAILAFGRTRAEDQDTCLMIRFSRDVPRREDQPIAAVITLGVDHAATGAGACHGIFLDGPGLGGNLGPVVEGFAIEQGNHVR